MEMWKTIIAVTGLAVFDASRGDGRDIKKGAEEGDEAIRKAVNK